MAHSPSPIDPSIKIRSNGIRIATEPSAKVKAIFKGEVLAIHLVKARKSVSFNSPRQLYICLQEFI